jgi:hypothetical protein
MEDKSSADPPATLPADKAAVRNSLQIVNRERTMMHLDLT